MPRIVTMALIVFDTGQAESSYLCYRLSAKLRVECASACADREPDSLAQHIGKRTWWEAFVGAESRWWRTELKLCPYGLARRRLLSLAGGVLHKDGIGELGVGIDPLDVVELFNLVEELEGLRCDFVVERGRVLGQHREFGGCNGHAGVGELTTDAVQVGRAGVDLDEAVAHADVLSAGIDGDEGDLFRVDIPRVKADQSLAVELPGHAARLTESPAPAGQGGAQIGNSAVPIIR